MLVSGTASARLGEVGDTRTLLNLSLKRHFTAVQAGLKACRVMHHPLPVRGLRSVKEVSHAAAGSSCSTPAGRDMLCCRMACDSALTNTPMACLQASAHTTAENTRNATGDKCAAQFFVAGQSVTLLCLTGLTGDARDA